MHAPFIPPTAEAPRHYCRNPRCRMKLKAPVENAHHGFCCSSCYASFYRSRCLVCEERLRRKNERQRFGSGHAVCRNEYRRFPHVYDYPKTGKKRGNGAYPVKRTTGLRNPHEIGTESGTQGQPTLIGADDFPINLLGGYRFPTAPRLEPTLRRAVLSIEQPAIVGLGTAP
jgi:hypothetical protein